MWSAASQIRPEHKDLIARLIDEPNVHLYAASSYLDEIGRSPSIETLSSAKLIGVGRKEQFLKAYLSLGLSVTENNLHLVCDNGVVGVEMLKLGFGIILMVEATAKLIAGIERVMLSSLPMTIPVWLTTWRELHTNARIRFVYVFLAIALRAIPRSTD